MIDERRMGNKALPKIYLEVEQDRCSAVAVEKFCCVGTNEKDTEGGEPGGVIDPAVVEVVRGDPAPSLPPQTRAPTLLSAPSPT